MSMSWCQPAGNMSSVLCQFHGCTYNKMSLKPKTNSVSCILVKILTGPTASLVLSYPRLYKCNLYLKKAGLWQLNKTKGKNNIHKFAIQWQVHWIKNYW